MLDQDKAVIDALHSMMPFFAQTFDGVAIAFSDNERYVYYKPGKKLDHKIKSGDKIKPGSMMDKCYKQKGFLTANVDAKVFGVSYRASGFPIFNADKEIIGGLVFCESVEMLENRNMLKAISEEISKNMSLMNNNMASLINRSEYINSTSKTLLVEAQESECKIQETNNIVNMIKVILNKTNMLSINAAIESTRAGADGAGFKVVSEEIRTLSLNTDEAIKKIEPIIKQIHSNSGDMTYKINEINESMGSIIDFITQTIEMANALNKSAKLIDSLADGLLKAKDGK